MPRIIENMDRKLCCICNETPRALFCSCIFPAIPICTVCIMRHINTTGSHYLTPALEVRPDESLPRVAGETCDECRNGPSAYFCVCTDPPSQFCESHSAAHLLKSTSSFHQKHPIAVLKIISSGRVKLESFNKRQAYMSTLEAKVNTNIAHLDRFIKTCSNEFERAVQALHNQEANLKTELDEVRNQLLEVLNTIERRRYEVNYMATTWLEHWVLDGYLTESFPDMNLFSGSINVQPVLDMIRTCSSYKKDVEPLMKRHLYLPVVKGKRVWRYDVPTLVRSELSLDLDTISTNGGSAYCFIDPVTILCCGGIAQSEVYQVNLEKSTAVKMPSLNSVREMPGIWKYNGYVYIFGGYIEKGGEYLTTAEKFSLTTKSWTALCTTLCTGKHACSVCEHAVGIFIAGIESGQMSIELFNPVSEQFTLLTVNAPTPGYCPLSVIVGDELSVMFGSTMLKAQLGSGRIEFTNTDVQSIGNGHYVVYLALDVDGKRFTVGCHGQRKPVCLMSYTSVNSQLREELVIDY